MSLTRSGGPKWWLFEKDDKALAGKALASLMLPVCGGEWQPASEITWAEGADSVSDWPWRLLDRPKLESCLPELSPSDIDDLITLMGVVPALPLRGSRLNDLEIAHLAMFERLSTETAELLLKYWSKFITPLLGIVPAAPLLAKQLVETSWMPIQQGNHFGGMEVRLPQQTTGSSRFSPQQFWLDLRSAGGGGMDMALLPRLVPGQLASIPAWVNDLLIGTLNQASVDRLRCGLSWAMSYGECHLTMETLYRQLVRELVKKSDHPSQIPCLVTIRNGSKRERRWLRDGEIALYDDGSHTDALSAFRVDLPFWTITKEAKSWAKYLGLQTFSPTPETKTKSYESQEKAEAHSAKYKSKLRRCLPDILLMAAARPGLSEPWENLEQAALAKWKLVKLEAVEDVTRTYSLSFNGEIVSGQAGGDGEVNQVYLKQKGSDSGLVFDGSPALTAFSAALAEALFDNQLFEPECFRILAAWGDNEMPGSEIFRLRAQIGLDQTDVQSQETRILSTELSDGEWQQWLLCLRDAILLYGTPDEDKLEPGTSVITQVFWKKVERAVAKQEDVKAAIGSAMRKAYSQKINANPSIWPQVDFFAANARRLDELRHTFEAALLEEAAANSADIVQDDAWAEWRTQQLENLNASSTDRTIQELSELCPSDVALCNCLRHRLGMRPCDQLPTFSPDEVIRRKAQGLLPAPPNLIQVIAGTFSIGRPAFSPQRLLSPETESDRALAASRNSQRGAEGEQQVLEHAHQQSSLLLASGWTKEMLLQALDDLFKKLVVSEDSFKTLKAKYPQSWEKRLHISKYWGDAGFDVLIPNPTDQSWTLAEVKRGNGHFFMSRNEVMAAAYYLAQGFRWRLLIVNDSGQIKERNIHELLPDLSKALAQEPFSQARPTDFEFTFREDGQVNT